MAAIGAGEVGFVRTSPNLAPTQKETILRAQRYEAESLTDLFDAYFDGLYTYIDSLTGRPEQTEELVRKTWRRALEGLPRYRRFDAGFETWLQRIANHLLSTEVLPTDLEETPERRLQQAIRGLTTDQLDVIGLRFVARLPVAEVARATGRSRTRVEALQHRALLALRRALSPAAPATTTEEA